MLGTSVVGVRDDDGGLFDVKRRKRVRKVDKPGVEVGVAFDEGAVSNEVAPGEVTDPDPGGTALASSGSSQRVLLKAPSTAVLCEAGEPTSDSNSVNLVRSDAGELNTSDSVSLSASSSSPLSC